jgi:hypothetical protein
MLKAWEITPERHLPARGRKTLRTRQPLGSGVGTVASTRPLFYVLGALLVALLLIYVFASGPVTHRRSSTHTGRITTQ